MRESHAKCVRLGVSVVTSGIGVSDWYTLTNLNLFLMVSAEQKEIGVKKDPTLQNTQVVSLCGSKVKVYHPQ